MTDQYSTLINVAETALYNGPKMTSKELRELLSGLNTTLAFELTLDKIESIARDIEFKQGIKAGLGAVVVDCEGEFEPWLDGEKANIDPFYWERYRKLLLRTGLPRDVIISIDTVTDKILSRLGNPNLNMQWDRRGMVVGHVQSGKTANYIGLISKAADAGYRLIIVIAGIHNNLRNQTQERIDEGFIGRDTGKSGTGFQRHEFGVGAIDSGRTPVSLTNTLKDFKKETASTNTSEIDSYRVPVVLVIKKNHRTLKNLLDWLRDNNARGDRDMIDQPMLLIDDEADNASINTNYGKHKALVTKINGQIRDLLGLFHRSCYVGYTATPFANIFIDPDQDNEMFNEDLFPRDFIIGLGAPSNYFGPSRLFFEGLPEDEESVWLRYIVDNEDILPIKHKIDHQLDTVPPSLVTALRTFLLARAIRNLRGQKIEHCSMLVNASRFTGIQGMIRNRLHEILENVQNAVRVNGNGGRHAVLDPEIAALHTVWQTEFSNTEFNWDTVQRTLFNAIASAKVVEVNSRSNDLEFPKRKLRTRGQTVIAVGGFSLSRGLTLEGLTVTWFLRNTMMYDTLMQMGRWFGYREGYEDLCRIWMPKEAIDWYAFIANASEELHDELRNMERVRATPKLFGLAVRGHPASLLVTARNKMGSGKNVTTMVGLSNAYVETSKVSIEQSDLEANLNSAKWLVSALVGGEFELIDKDLDCLWRGIPVDLIDGFLTRWRNAEQCPLTNTDPIRSYIGKRSDGELNKWDVLIPSIKSGNSTNSLGIPVAPMNRHVGVGDLRHGFMSFSGRKMRVASRGIEKAGVDPKLAALAEREYRSERMKSATERVNFPDRIYRRWRDRPLFILFFVQPQAHSKERHHEDTKLIPTEPVVAWGLSLPPSARKEERVEYVVNTVRYKELFGEVDDDDDIEDALRD